MDKDDLQKLYELLSMDEYVPSLVAFFEAQLKFLTDRILSYDLTAPGHSIEGLAFEKCRAEGARKLLNELKQQIKTFKEKRTKAKS